LRICASRSPSPFRHPSRSLPPAAFTTPGLTSNQDCYKAYALKDDAELPEDPDRLLEGQVPWRV